VDHDYEIIERIRRPLAARGRVAMAYVPNAHPEGVVTQR
jgi:hypothetical protein